MKFKQIQVTRIESSGAKVIHELGNKVKTIEKVTNPS